MRRMLDPFSALCNEADSSFQIVLGTIPAKCPSMPLAVSALRDLDQVHDLFTNMGEKARAGKVLVRCTAL